MTLFIRGQGECANPVRISWTSRLRPNMLVAYPYRAMLEWVWLRKDKPKTGGTCK
jgi:hypothetical protein